MTRMACARARWASQSGHENRHLEHQRRQGAARGRASPGSRRPSPDVACFQEIKCVDEAFPAEAFEELGYNVAVHGQKGFNGVAILSKRPFDEVAVRGLPGDDSDAHARYIEVLVPRAGGVVRVGNLYLPNGNPIGTDKFAYKLAWMQRFEARTRELLELEEPFLLLGDYNVIPEPVDAKNPQAWTEDALFQPETRAAFRALAQPRPDRRACAPAIPGPASTPSGTIRPAPGRRTTASASTTSWPRRRPPTGCVSAGVDKFTRGWEKPSDHVPVWVELERRVGSGCEASCALFATACSL